MKDAGQILRELFEKRGIKQKKLSGLFRQWKDYCGQDLEEHSEIEDITDETLYILVDHPGWKQMVQLRKSELLGKINTVHPELKVKDLKIKMVSVLPKNKYKKPEIKVKKKNNEDYVNLEQFRIFLENLKENGTKNNK